MDQNQNRRILIIDDNQAIHDDFRKILGNRADGADGMAQANTAMFGFAPINGAVAAHFEIDSALQGSAGLACVEHALAAGRPYAMAFIDVWMPPGWDGIETAERIWKVDPELQIVISTAYSDYSWNEAIAKVGQSDRLVILKKPFDNIEALQLALALTNKWHLSRQARLKVNELGDRVRESTNELMAINASLRAEVAERKQAEEALRESQEHYRTLVESQGEGVLITNLDRCFTFANPAAETILGAWPGQLVGKKLDDFVDEENQAVIQEQFKLRQAGKKTSYEIEITAARGEQRQILITGTPQTDSAGRFCGTFAVFRDITLRKKAERVLRESQRLLKAILDNIPDPAWLKDAEGRYLVGNKSLARVYRRGMEEIVGKTVLEVLPEHAAKLVQGDTEIVRSRKPARGEVCIPDADGNNRWFDSIETPIFDEQNEITGMAGIARDVTERKQLEAGLRESEARYRSLFDNMLEGFACCRMIFDQDCPRDFVYLEVNAAFEKLTGLKNVIGKTATEVIPGIRKTNPELFEIYSRVALTGKPEKFETYVDALGIWFSVAVYSYQKEQFVAIFDNITQRKRIEEDLRLKTTRFEALVNSSPEGILVVNEQGQKIIQNPQFNELLKIPRQLAEQSDDHEQLRYVADSTKHPEQFREKVLHLYAHPEETSRDEIEFKDGRILDRYSAPVLDRNGKSHGRIWMFRDITERKRIEEALRESEKLLRDMGRTAKIGGWELNPSTGEGRWTEEVSRIHDLEPTVRPDRTMGTAFYRGPSRTLIEVAVQEAIDHGTPYDLELELISAKGKPKWIRTICEPLMENGKAIKLRGSFQDITARRRAEEKLLLQTSALEAAANGIVITDCAGKILWVNHAFTRLTGYDRSEVIGQTPAVLKSGNHSQQFYQELWDRILSGKVWQGELVNRRKDGSHYYEEMTITPVFGKQGEILNFVAVKQDISQRKQSEADLRDSEEKHRLLFESSRDAILTITPPGWKFTAGNPAAIAMFGARDEKDFCTAGPHDVSPERQPDGELSSAKARRMIEIAMTGGFHCFDWMHRRFTGEEFPVSILLTRMQRGSDVFLLASLRDITERKQAEERLRESQRLLQSALDAIALHIAVLDARGVIIAVNAMWKNFAAGNQCKSPAFCLGSNYLEVCGCATGECAQEAAAVVTGLRAVMANEQAEFHLEYPCHGPGEQRWFMMHVTRIDGDSSMRVVVAHENITQRKLADDKLEEAHRQLVETSREAGMAEMATGVLHNVGNVLNSVNVCAGVLSGRLKKSKLPFLGRAAAMMKEHANDLGEFMSRDPKGLRLPAYLGELAEQLAGEQAVALNELAELHKSIEHIKHIVTVQQGCARTSGSAEKVQVTDLAEDALKMNASAFSRHDILVVRDFHDVPGIVAEKHKVLQILVNLMRNAAQACDETDRPDKQLTIRLTNGGNCVRMAVMDNGVGIPPENLGRIFDRGFTTKKDGHGFGLHSCLLAAREMGGSLLVHTGGSGQGACFTLELPLQPSPAPSTP